MDKLLIFVLLIISTTVLGDESGGRAVGHGHRSPHAPKRLRNRPIEAENAWTSTLESNTYQGTVYLSPYIGYSGFNGWDISVASYNIPVQGGGAQNFEFDTYLGISKAFKLSNTTQLLIGTQNGTTLLANSNRQWHNMTFSNIRQDITENVNVYVGPYYANAKLTTTVNQIGFMTGFEWKMFPNKFHLTGDYVSGHQNVSGAVVNLQYFIVPKAQVYIGIIVPETNSGNEYAGVVGFNISTKDL